MEWLTNLCNAVKYIEKNLDGDINYEEAARIACCSTYYFKRMFSYVVGISPSEYIRRRKMTQAAFEIQTTDTKILEVALKYGYTSPTSFNRAFQNMHGISPICAREKGIVLNAYPPVKFSVTITGGEVMPYRVEEKAEMRIVGIRMPLTMDMDENQRIVPPFWKKTLNSNLFTQITDMNNLLLNKVLGITACQNADEIYYYIAVSTESSVPNGMHECIIPAATWVIFENVGYFKESIQNIYKRFLIEWLPFSGYSYAELPDIEVYPINAELPQSGHFEVWIAIKKEREK